MVYWAALGSWRLDVISMATRLLIKSGAQISSSTKWSTGLTRTLQPAETVT